MGRRTWWFPFARSKNRPCLGSIEPRIRPLVDALNATGLVRTFTSCEGHYGYRGARGDVTLREQASVGLFPRRGVSEDELVRFFGKVLAEYELHPVRGATLEVAKRFAAALDGSDVPESYFELAVRPFDPHASNAAKRTDTDRALAEVARGVWRVAGRRGERTEESPRADIEAALAAHGTWKTRLAAVVADGATAADVLEAERDDRCAIGRWLHGRPEARAHPRFEEIVALHARFHREASSALRHALAAKDDEARRLIAAGSAYSRISADLARALRSWAA